MPGAVDRFRTNIRSLRLQGLLQVVAIRRERENLVEVGAVVRVKMLDRFRRRRFRVAASGVAPKSAGVIDVSLRHGRVARLCTREAFFRSIWQSRHTPFPRVFWPSCIWHRTARSILRVRHAARSR